MKHNPAFLTPEEIVRSFVVRHRDLDLVLERLRDAAPDASPHSLLIGPRGSGKTTLVLRAVADVKADPALASRYYPIVFGEESYEVTTAAELWLEAVYHLGVQTKDTRFSEAFRAMKAERDEERLLAQALGVLLDFADSQKKRLLVVVENLNMILGEQVSDDEGWRLRHTLLNEPRIVLLATATGRFDQIENHKKALYDLLWTHDLRPLEAEECRTLWAAISRERLEGDRIRPVQILTGGNARLLAILAGFAAKMSLGELMSDLSQLVDDHTTYFKSNLEVLAPAERRIYVALADIWSPATAREVAYAARTDVNKASAMLHRLVSRGAVEPVSRGKQTRYQVAERLYNIYHLMRRTSGEESRVRAVVEFMVHFYDREQFVRVAGAIADEARTCEPGGRADYYLVYAELTKHVERDLFERIIASTPTDFFALDDAPKGIRALLAQANRASAAAVGKFETAEQVRSALAKRPDDPELWTWLAVLHLRDRRFDEAERAAKRSVELEPSSAAYGVLATSALVQSRYADAAGAARLGMKQRPYEAILDFVLGAALLLLGRADEAAEALQRAHAKLPTDADIAKALGMAHELRSADAEAEGAYRSAVEAEPDAVEAWRGLWRVALKAGRFDRVEEALRRIIVLDPLDAQAFASLSAELLRQERWPEARDAAEKGVALEPSRAVGWQVLALAQLETGMAVEAERTIRSAVALDRVESKRLLKLVLRARLQCAADASTLASEYLALSESRAPLLAALARAVISKGWNELYAQAKTWTVTAMEDEPGEPTCRLAHLLVLAALCEWPQARDELEATLADAPVVEAEKAVLIDTLVSAAAALGPAAVLQMLRSAPTVDQFEPLVDALALASGEEPNVPVEVREVADDVLRRIDERRTTESPAPARSNGAARASRVVAVRKRPVSSKLRRAGRKPRAKKKRR